MPIKVAVFNRKGGVGKTTLSIILTQIALMHGKKVLAIDQDEQANFLSSVDYLRTESRFKDLFTLKTSFTNEDTDTQADWLIIDCPPAFNDSSRFAMRNADLVLIPTRPDIYSTMAFTQLKEAAGDGKYSFQFAFVKVGFAYNTTSRLASEKLTAFRDKGHPIIGDLPLYASIPANISSDRKKWWCTGLQASARLPFEKVYTRLEALYNRLQQARKKSNYKPDQSDSESSKP